MTIHVQTQAASPIDVIDEDKFTAIRFGFRKRREFSRLRAESFSAAKIPAEPQTSEQ
jgi:hypothetical protein